MDGLGRNSSSGSSGHPWSDSVGLRRSSRLKGTAQPHYSTISSSSDDDETFSPSSGGNNLKNGSDIEDSSSEESSVLFPNEIMIGADFQAQLPEKMKTDPKRNQLYADHSFCQWKPSEALSEDQIKTYLERAGKESTANGKHLGMDQLLGLLFHCRYNVASALKAVQNHRSSATGSNYWPRNDRNKFEEALAVCGKDFKEIHKKWLPEKSLRSIVQFYYESKMGFKKLGLLRPKPGCGSGNSEGSGGKPGCSVVSVTFLSKPAFRRLSSSASCTSSQRLSYSESQETRHKVVEEVTID